MKILLVYPTSQAESGFIEVQLWLCEPLCLSYLATGAQAEGHEVRILDLRLHPDELDRTLREYRPDLVGVTGYTMHVYEVRKICARAKELLPRTRTVVGGHHATVLPEDFFRPEVDYVVIGEGQSRLVEILRCLEAETEPLEVADVWTRIGTEFVSGGAREGYDINALAPPDREVNLADRGSYFMADMNPIALMRMSEGCVYSCSFCSLWKLMRGRYLVRDDDAVLAELERIQEESIHIIDDEPWLNRKRMANLAKRIETAGIGKRYFSYCRVDTLTRHPELIESWRRIGLDKIFLGIEAVSPAELGDYDKRIEPHQIESALTVAADLDLTVYALFIVNPDYTKKQFQRLERFIERHRIDHPSFTIMTPLPGTDQLRDFSRITELGTDGRPNWALFDLQHPVTATRLPRADFMARVDRLRRNYHNPD